MKFSAAKENGVSEISLLGDGSPIREFLHVEDFASAIEFILVKELYSEPIINVAGSTSWTIKDLSKIIQEATNYKGKITFANDGKNGAMVKLLDSSMLNSHGWHPKISLPVGVARVLSNFGS